MSIECEQTPIRCNSKFINPRLEYVNVYCRNEFMLRPLDRVEIGINADRSLYNSINCNCIQEYGYFVVAGFVRCFACRVPMVALDCGEDRCFCPIDLDLTRSNSTIPIVVDDEELLGNMRCALEIDPRLENMTPIGNAIFSMNIRSITRPNAQFIERDRKAATFVFNNYPSRLFTINMVDGELVSDLVEEVITCCDGSKIRGYRIIIAVGACVRLLNSDITPYTNTKEDFEVLRGLFIGRYAYEEWIDQDILKRARSFDIL